MKGTTIMKTQPSKPVNTHLQTVRSRLVLVRLSLLVLLLSLAAASRAVTFSTDATSGVLNGPGDLLNPGGVAIPPPIILPGGGPEVNAFSYGHPGLGSIDTSRAFFSVSLGSAGLVGTAVRAESSANPGDESADIFSSVIGSGINLQVFDGDGVPHTLPAAPALGLPEPPLALANLDALDLRSGPLSSLYWSVNPLSAAAAPYAPAGSPADVWFSPPVPGFATMPALYAPSAALGLLGADDIDALVVVEDGTAGFAFATDTVFLSLAPGSPSLALLGAGPGDILAVGGGSGLSIFATAASIGLGPLDNLDALDFAVIPEPATASLLLLWALGLAALRRQGH